MSLPGRAVRLSQHSVRRGNHVQTDAADGRTVALYWDFENIHAGLCDEREPGSYRNPDARFRPQEPLVNVQAVVDLAASFGPIAINRAYCNWQ